MVGACYLSPKRPGIPERTQAYELENDQASVLSARSSRNGPSACLTVTYMPATSCCVAAGRQFEVDAPPINQ